MKQILSTKDYKIFKKHESNRDIDKSNLKNLIFSIQSHNMLEFRPIIVNKHMQIIDGQHRLEAAKHLGEPIFYQIQEESKVEDIMLLNQNQKKWSTEDYINYYDSIGNIEYRKLLSYCQTKKIEVNEFLTIYAGIAGRKMDNVRYGKFRFEESTEIKKLEEYMWKMEQFYEIANRYLLENKRFLKSTRFKKAFITFLKLEDIDFNLFLTKVELKVSVLRSCQKVKEYFDMLVAIYNWKNRNPVNPYSFHIEPNYLS